MTKNQNKKPVSLKTLRNRLSEARRKEKELTKDERESSKGKALRTRIDMLQKEKEKQKEIATATPVAAVDEEAERKALLRRAVQITIDSINNRRRKFRDEHGELKRSAFDEVVEKGLWNVDSIINEAYNVLAGVSKHSSRVRNYITAVMYEATDLAGRMKQEKNSKNVTTDR